MLDEVLEWLAPAPGQVFVDGTAGGGGHTAALATRVGPTGRIFAMDLDEQAIDRCQALLAELPVELAIGSYAKIPELLTGHTTAGVDGILLDLGLSSDQLADATRGFSYQSDGPLDLRFDATRGEPAWQLLQRLDEKSLADVIYRYGEERFSRRIARRIVERRREQPLRTAGELAALVRGCVPRSRGHDIDPATRTFQALRIAVNQELDQLSSVLTTSVERAYPLFAVLIVSSSRRSATTSVWKCSPNGLCGPALRRSSAILGLEVPSSGLLRGSPSGPVAAMPARFRPACGLFRQAPPRVAKPEWSQRRRWSDTASSAASAGCDRWCRPAVPWQPPGQTAVRHLAVVPSASPQHAGWDRFASP